MPAPMFLLRGAPGAGKSTFANNLRGTENAFIFETDNFFVDSIDKRTYHFNPKLLGIAHSWNQGEVIRACRDCPDVPVIVANTFCRLLEYEPYLEIAKAFKRKVYIITLYTEHDNIHNVPAEVVERRREKLEDFDVSWVVNKGYPVAYHYRVYTDKEAADIAQTIHLKYVEK